MLADHLEDRPFQNERVVNGHEADTLGTIPAGLAATGDAGVHNIIGNKKIGLHLELVVNGASFWHGGREADPFNSPTKDGGLEVFRLCELATLEDRDGVDDAHAAVELSTRYVIVHTLSGSKTWARRGEETLEGRTR